MLRTVSRYRTDTRRIHLRCNIQACPVASVSECSFRTLRVIRSLRQKASSTHRRDACSRSGLAGDSTRFADVHAGDALAAAVLYSDTGALYRSDSSVRSSTCRLEGELISYNNAKTASLLLGAGCTASACRERAVAERLCRGEE